MKTVHLVSIGDELLLGQVVNTNAVWLSQQLFPAGFKVDKITVIPDDKEVIINILDESIGHFDAVIFTGGLGPTNDDMTKQTLASYFNKKLKLNNEALEMIKKVLERRGVTMNKLNEEQALLPENTILIPNENGTAWGMIFEKNGTFVVSLPGVPFEMKPMFENHVLPFLKNNFKTQEFYQKTIHIQGIAESDLAIKLTDWENNLPQNIKLAYLPQPGLVRLRLSSSGENIEEIKKIIDKEVEKLKKILGEHISGYDDKPIEVLIGEMLKENHMSVATAESCTGGYIAHLITSVAGASEYYKGSVVSYANETKINVLGVNKDDINKYGAVSRQVVEQMAKGVKNLINTDFAVAVSGIAGPTGGTPDKPVGTTWIAIATPEKVISQKFIFGKERDKNIKRTALQALNMLRIEIYNHTK
jgi:nicotinamide-nucleotide amidase